MTYTHLVDGTDGSTVTISSDPNTLGPEATEGDVERYAQRLAKSLAVECGRTVHVRTESTGQSRADDDIVQAALERIESTNEWQEIVFG